MSRIVEGTTEDGRRWVHDRQGTHVLVVRVVDGERRVEAEEYRSDLHAANAVRWREVRDGHDVR